MQKRLRDISVHLLDLGKRNRLLNYKDTGFRTIDVLNDNIEGVFNKLISSSVFSIYNLDSVLAKYHKTIDGTSESVSEYSKAKVKDITKEVLRPNDILCYKQGQSLSKVFKIIYREYKNTLLEKGINTLYFTFGLVGYKEKKENYLAPLLLIPLDCDALNGNYKIKESDDEIIVNPTLAYLLKNEYHVDLGEYVEKDDDFNSFISKIKNKLYSNGLTYHDHMSIGIYSFLKMNMFNDLTVNSDIALKNKNILRLLDQAIPADSLDDLDIYPVVEADSSQLEAIRYATNGASFVLQGPPGSGKSQTITNIIASAIGNGKKVLFVSEKQAALNVVYENLKRAGLADFALELHSHKANKKEFIDELYRTAILPRYDINNDAQNIKEKYGYLKDKLDEYRQNLHRVIPRLNLSMYDIYSNYLKLDTPKLKYQINNVKELDNKYLEQSKEALNSYIRIANSLNYDYRGGSLFGYIAKDLSYIRYNAKEDLEALVNFYQELKDIKNRINKELPINLFSFNDILSKIELLKKIVDINYFMPDYFDKRKRAFLLNNLEDYLKASKYISSSTISHFFNLDILSVNVVELLYNFKSKSSSVLKYLSPAYHKLKKQINLYAKIKMSDNDLVYKLEEINEYKKMQELFVEAKKNLPQDYRPYEYEIIYNDLVNLESLEFDLKLDVDSYQQLKLELLDILLKFNKNSSINLINYIDKFDNEVIDLANGNIDTVYKQIYGYYANADLLELHAQRLDLIDKMERLSLIEYLNKFLDKEIPIGMLTANYEALFYQANMYYEIEINPILKEFTGLGIDSLIEEFKRFDKANLETNKAMVISKLSNLRPDDSIMAGTKFSILIKEYNKSRKQKPIRVLLEEIFDLALDIKPLFLMSPLSVSTYLNSRLDMFDLVIFDEASQVFAWDALGAIYRAKQCIIIGDSKQMPPSNFFNALLNDEDVDNDSDDSESILDKGSSVLATKQLNWHYRSRSEELIEFSNREFYDSRLITIPQAKSHKEGFGIDFHYLSEGIYEVKTRINKIEANHIVDLVFKHFKEKPNQSLGVVAFSNAQADYIWSLIEERMEEEPNLRDCFSLEKEEPFFVKNLESVQGDERDRIIFSICYGYNNEGKFYQRFGPLNNIGGERRLNVAITRAKYNVCVVSSILAKDISVDNTESVGVKLLKGYLDYVANVTTPKHVVDTDFDGVSNDIFEFLREEGFLVQKKIGTSNFKVDLAVMHPITKEFVVAIMLDGAAYRIGNCSDANRLQEILLERQGWKYYRIFSTLWINSPKLEKDKLRKFLENAFNSNDIVRKESYDDSSSSLLVENKETFDDSFVEYKAVSDEKIMELYNNKSTRYIIKHIVSKEEPIHIDYLLKRICFMYGRTKVTNIVRQYFEEDLEDLDLYCENNFLSIKKPLELSLRINSDRSIEYVHTLELQDAIYKIVKKSNGITKEGCFKNVVKLLGYNRMTDNAINYLEDALVFLKLDGKIVEKNDCLYV